MGRATSDETRLSQGRGTGHHAEYKPFILARETRQKGTASNLIDWIHHRVLQLLSQGELWAYVLLRWRDDTDDIREQFPLDSERVAKIAEQLGRPKPRRIYTTDLLVTKTDGTLVAYSVKNSLEDLNDENTVFRLKIEMDYWHEQGVDFHMVFKDDLNRTLCENILDCVRFYDIDSVSDRFSMVKHLIAHKKLKPDLHKKLDYGALADAYIRKGSRDLWIQDALRLAR